MQQENQLTQIRYFRPDKTKAQKLLEEIELCNLGIQGYQERIKILREEIERLQENG